jgi:hypothetical protein
MSDNDKETTRLLLENKLHDIRYTKQQQWHILYLTIIAIAGITALALKIESRCLSIFLIVADCLIALIGLFFTIYYAWWLGIYRVTKMDLLSSLGHTDSEKRNGSAIITFFFCAIIVLSSIISIWAISIKLV